MSIEYPAEASGPFPAPPRSIDDAAGREIHLRQAESADRESLVEMYRAFDPADRAQGIPPCRESDIREWLASITERDTRAVVALHESRPVGHGMLVADSEGGYELALFVLQAYQGAGIGTALLETLLGLGAETGVERVWLTVERWNDPAIAVYEKVGFERTDDSGFELEMAMRLD
ncbi:MAG: N-acetyltransferase family protein [Salinirussus sp.]